MRMFPRVLVLVLTALPEAVHAQGTSQARLLLEAVTVRPGTTLEAAVELVPPTGWHTYWRNPGETGQATKVDWNLPDGIAAGEIRWPAPERLTEADITTYVYEGKVLLPITLRIADSVPSGTLTLQAKVSWLECKTECLPGRATVKATLQIGAETKASESAALIRAAIESLPRPGAPGQASAHWGDPAKGDTRVLRIKPATPGASDFFPYPDETFEWTWKSGGSSGVVDFSVAKVDNAWPKEIRGLLVTPRAGATPEGVEVTLPITDTAPTAPTTGTVTTPPSPTPADAPPVAKGLWAMLGLAFIGGLILNIMPCVLPVIALKILGFVRQSGENPARVRQLGFIYTAGVLSSFAVLAGLVIAVQSAGRTASWGMQFQNPIFLVGITTLVTLVALNLFGVFEISLHSSALGAASQLASKEGASGAFFNGVFTTVLATPCTAPFLGTALGFAFGEKPSVLLAIFLTAGLGLATPYLMLSLQPAWLRYLPKPGNWMITFKVLMGFPMIATAVWLLSQAADQFGESGVFLEGLFLVCVAFAAWVFGQWIQTGTGNRGWSWTLILIALGVGYFGILDNQLHWRAPQIARPTASTPGDLTLPRSTKEAIAWARWSPDAVTHARAEGRPVLVDFTAKWCLTCRVNEATAIDVPSVREQLAALDVVSLRGDYTREDPAITEELRRFQRAGVPLVLVYPKNPSLPPRVLPNTLTRGIVEEALQWAAK
ncbi:MAG: DUF255 domain-containing protein [Verrucomicrobia bacterium]|nr:DUF255 domain-containing protein [Verrucomicrobiota bacterium]